MPFELLVVAALALFTLILMIVTIEDSALDRRQRRRPAEPAVAVRDEPVPSMSASLQPGPATELERADERMAA